MSVFVKLTRADGPDCYIRKDSVQAVELWNGATTIILSARALSVQETIEQVMQKLKGETEL